MKTVKLIYLFWFSSVLLFLSPSNGLGKIYIDINAPSVQRIQVAIPDFMNFSSGEDHPELAADLPAVIADDLDLSGYFLPMDKAAFLEKNKSALTYRSINFKDWSIIGAELLIKGKYTCIGRSLEVEIRLFDVFRGRQILGKRALGKTGEYRALMHRLGNEIVYILTGHKGMFLSRLVFVNKHKGNKEIYLSDYDGHNVKRITFDKNIALLPRWSPAGDKIIYNSYKDGGPMLYMKDMASGMVKRISARKGLNTGACWAIDGKSMVLTLSHGKNPDIYSIDLNGKILNRLTNHWAIDVSPTFSPDGKKIAFVSNRSGSPQIYLRDLVEGKEERLTFEGKYNTSPVWSRLNRIAFSGMNDGHFDIFSINPDGTNIRKLTESNSNNEDPCWSMDGRYIIFSSNRDGGYHLYIMNANGQNQKRITTLKGEQSSPSWSPF